MTYDESPAAHIQTEFGFDVLQVAQGHYASEAYHDFIGFKVSKPLLERAFKETYGIELTSHFYQPGSGPWHVSLQREHANPYNDQGGLGNKEGRHRETNAGYHSRQVSL